MNESITLTVWCGIDVSKKKLDCAIAKETGKHTVFKVDNDLKGFESLVKWALAAAAEGAVIKFCMEATGDYGVDLALTLAEKGYHVSVVNPAQVKFFGGFRGRLNKTDKADAKLIADFAQQSNPPASPLNDANQRELLRLYRRYRQLVAMRAAEMNRRECPHAIGQTCMDSISESIRTIGVWIHEVELKIEGIVNADPTLKSMVEIITSIPALGKGSAYAILAEMPPIESADSAKSWAAASGSNPTTKQSGDREKPGSISRGGRKNVRTHVWMPILKSYKQMPELKSLYDRLRVKGLTHRQALTACVHKLFMILYGMLKSKTKYSIEIATANAQGRKLNHQTKPA